jgi:hypothetical protein
LPKLQVISIELDANAVVAVDCPCEGCGKRWLLDLDRDGGFPPKVSDEYSVTEDTLKGLENDDDNDGRK